MGKRQAAGNKFGLEPWQSVIPADEAGYVRIGFSVLEHPAFQQLTPSARLLYLCLLKAAKNNNTFTYSKAAYERDGFDNSTARRAIAQLIGAGFITRSRSWKIGQASTYEFCSKWKA